MRTCPNCGAEISETAKFCSECGYNVIDGSTYNKTLSKEFWQKIVPNILFIVFAVLLFAIYAEPVASIFGVSASVYLLCDSAVTNDAGLSALSIVLVVLAVLTVIAAVAIAIVKYLSYKNGKAINSKLDWISFAFYVLYFIIGFVICIIIANYEVLYVGACPVLLIVLSVIFIFLLGTVYVYNKNSTVVATIDINSIDDSVSSNQHVNKAESKKTLHKKANSDSKAKPHRKKSMALLPIILFLVVDIIMWVMYFLPSIRYIRDVGQRYIIYYISILDIDFADIGTATKMFINIFQYILIAYLSIVSVVAVILLIWGILRIKRDNTSSINVCWKTLLVILILYSIFFVLSLSLFLFTMTSKGITYEFWCVAIVVVAALSVLGTMIAMVKIKKKRNQKVIE